MDIDALLKPIADKPAGRKAWGIDLETIWIPFFTGTNAVGKTYLPPDALGAPIRLVYDNDGSVRFSRLGKPITRVAKDLAETIKKCRFNLTAGLIAKTAELYAKDKAGYKAQVEMARKAGEPIITRDRTNLDKALILAMEKQVAKAEADAEARAETRDTDKVPVTA